MKQRARLVMGVGLGLLLLSLPLGTLGGRLFLQLWGGMDAEFYRMIVKQAIGGVQILGGILLALGGAARLSEGR